MVYLSSTQCHIFLQQLCICVETSTAEAGRPECNVGCFLCCPRQLTAAWCWVKNAAVLMCCCSGERYEGPWPSVGADTSPVHDVRQAGLRGVLSACQSALFFVSYCCVSALDPFDILGYINSFCGCIAVCSIRCGLLSPMYRGCVCLSMCVSVCWWALQKQLN